MGDPRGVRQGHAVPRARVDSERGAGTILMGALALLALLLVATAALLLQAAAPAPERFSILVPVADQPCTRRPAPDEIVVCADALPTQQLPLPGEAVSPRPVAVNRDLTGSGALAAEGTPCAARVGGCQVGVDMVGAGTAVIRGIQKLVAPNSCCEEPGEATNPLMLVRDLIGGAKKVAAGKPDKSRRIAIPLDDTPPARRILP